MSDKERQLLANLLWQAQQREEQRLRAPVAGGPHQRQVDAQRRPAGERVRDRAREWRPRGRVPERRDAEAWREERRERSLSPVRAQDPRVRPRTGGRAWGRGGVRGRALTASDMALEEFLGK